METKRVLILALASWLCTAVTTNLFVSCASAAGKTPAVGDIIEGFKVISLGEISSLGAKCVNLEHEKTGAKVVMIKNDDPNATFSIAFRTGIENDKGIPHIYEHATLCGSNKYPSSSLFFSMIGQTYSSFLNASTYPDFTLYPSSSLSEKQLIANFDYYLNGTFDPVIMTDEHAKMREAYRYELENPDGEITLTGTVYSEMLGAMNTLRSNIEQVYRSLYPGSMYTYNSGGNPDDILTVTWQELKDFHEQYYHPSNALIMLYGKLEDPNHFLKMMDDCFKNYERRNISMEDKHYTPIKGAHKKVHNIPATEDGDDTAYLTYAITLTGVTPEEVCRFKPLTKWLNLMSSPIRAQMQEKMPGVQFLECDMDVDVTYPTLLFLALGASEDNMDTFKEIVDDVLKDVVENEANYDNALLSLATGVVMENGMTLENSRAGAGIIAPFITTYWAATGNPFKYLDVYRAIENMEQFAKDGKYNELFKKYLSSPEASVLVLTKPERGGVERREAELNKKLADMKAAMTPDEIDALVARTADFKQWSERNAANTMIEKVNVVKVKDLPDGISRPEAKEGNADGMCVITAEAGTGEVLSTSFIFDTSSVPFEDLREYALAFDLMGTLPTATRTAEELEVAAQSIVYGFSASTTTSEHEDGSYTPILNAHWFMSKTNMSEAFDIVSDILLNTDYANNADKIRQLAAFMAATMRANLESSPHGFALKISRAMVSEAKRYEYYLESINFYEKIANMDDGDVAKFASKIAKIQELIYNKANLTFVCIGDTEGIKTAEECAKQFYSKLGDDTPKPVNYSEVLPKYESPLALVINGVMQYNYLIAPTKKLTDEPGNFITAMSLAYSNILIPVMRYQNGVYSPLQHVDFRQTLLGAYRDPGITATREVFRNLGELMRTPELTQDDLNGAVMGAYSTVIYPEGPLSGAWKSIGDKIDGTDMPGYYRECIKQMKSITPDDIKNVSEGFDKLAQNGAWVTVGGSLEIEKNRDLFKTVLTTDDL